MDSSHANRVPVASYCMNLLWNRDNPRLQADYYWHMTANHITSICHSKYLKASFSSMSVNTLVNRLMFTCRAWHIYCTLDFQCTTYNSSYDNEWCKKFEISVGFMFSIQIKFLCIKYRTLSINYLNWFLLVPAFLLSLSYKSADMDKFIYINVSISTKSNLIMITVIISWTNYIVRFLQIW